MYFVAFILKYTDSYGDEYPNSYWRVVLTNLCKEDKTANIVFYGYQDKEHAGKRIIGQKQYAPNGEEFDKYFAADTVSPEGVNHLSQAYQYVLDKDDFFKEAKLE